MKPAVVRQAGWERSRALHSPAPAAGVDLAASTAAPGEAHHASLPSATHRTAPEAESGAAVVAKRFAGEVTTDADVAGMLGPAGVTRPEVHDSPGLPDVVQMQGGDRAASGNVALATLEEAATEPTQQMDCSRQPVVLHVDIDAFFAAIEQQRDPRLRGKPVIVGAGVIASCSYEARRFGLRAGMTLSEAKRLCPAAVILEGHAQIYRCFAEEIFARCRLVAPAVETYLDEAYCDLSGTERLHGDLLATARDLKRAILAATGLTVTCGLGPNRMIAKLAGKLVKPDGLARVTAAEADAFVRDRPVEQIAGVGHAHAKVLRSMNVRTANDLRALSVAVLERLFGAPGRMLYERCRGRDTAAIHEREVPLSISRETSFHRDTADRAEIEGMLEYLVGRACRTARELGIRPRTVSLRLRYGDGESAEQARSLAQPSDADPVVLARVLELLQRLFTRRAALHAIGATLSNFSPAGGEQGALFDEREAGRRAALYRAFDGVRDHFGHGILVSGRALHLRGRLEQDEHGFILRTPSLTK